MDDDDTTIDNDLSSLNSFAESPLPAALQPSSASTLSKARSTDIGNVSSYSSSFESPSDEDKEDDRIDEVITSYPPATNQDSSIPSWAQTESTETPETIRSPGRGPLQHELEDMPVGTGVKTFEELLEEKLALSSDVPDQPSPVRNDKGKGKTFLKKGAGLVRYGGVGSPPKSFKRSVSTANVSQKAGNSVQRTSSASSRMKSSKSCSRLDIAERETIAFSSMPRASFESDRNHIMVYDRKTGSLTDATEGLDQTTHGG